MPLPMRRQRLLTFCAVVIVFMLYRVFQNSWDDANVYAELRSGYSKAPGAGHPPPPADYNGIGDDVLVPPVERPRPAPIKDVYDKGAPIVWDNAVSPYDSEHKKEEDLAVKVPELEDKEPDTGGDSTNGPSEEGTEPKSEETEQHELDEGGLKGSPTEEKDEGSDTPTKTTDEELDIQYENPPNDESNKAILDESKIHWKKSPEHFPIPEESIIPLPTGEPKAIPRIQFEFKEESEEDKEQRLQRQQRVKTEIARSWGGYRKYAWMHDELSPVSGKSRDPFCGWAATLVDSLDTLWIAGLRDEFDEAVRAAANIDFTTTKKNDIPVFETTIRYLGGLLSAYDLSGGHEGNHKVLLDKAIELGEILMSIFDTPNRMPVLYYQWKPVHASQPRRAGRVGIAEIGSLSMEFTRLAQLTRDNKYYDAIDRITNGLVEMQEAGTAIPGLFPENLDASGCNKTATAIRKNISKAAQKQLESEELLEEPEGYIPDNDESDLGTQEMVKEDDRVEKRDLKESEIDLSEGEWKTIPDTEAKNRPPFAADGSTSEWDCVPQGIVPSGYGYESYHVGGSQDSAYEYFPKEYLLLGGLEPKYQKLYEDAVDAVNEWLMFRPMAQDDWKVLFPAKMSVNSRNDNSLSAEFEITHLTCFIGGMYGLGGKIFGREADVEMAKELTDGCVWAYQLMRSGLMAENANVIPCPGLEKCDFNETLWHDRLDQSRSWRERELAKWEKEAEEMQEAARLQEAANIEDSSPPELEESNPEEAKEAEELETYSPDEGEEAEELETDGSDEAKEAEELKQTAQEYTDTPDSSRDSLRKRAAIPLQESDDDAESELPDSLKKKLGLGPYGRKDSEESTADDGSKPERKVEPVTNEKSDEAGGDRTSVPRFSAPARMTPDRKKPQSHDEFVKKRIEKEGLPPGFTEIRSSHYILR